MTFAALDLMVEMITDLSFEEMCDFFTRNSSFTRDSKGVEMDSAALVSVLWESRDKFFVLCSRGLLPGCSLLLLTMFTLLSIRHQTDTTMGLALTLLQDLVLRTYLVGSHRDRQILHFICPHIIPQNEMEWSTGIKSPEDSRAIAGSFTGLLLVTQHSANVKNTPIDFMGYLVGFVFHATKLNPTVTASEMIEVAETSLQFLWLLLHEYGRIAAKDQHKVRFYAATFYRFLGFIEREHTSTSKDRLGFARLLARGEVMALTGRVVLLMLEEGKEFKNVELHARLIQDMNELEEPFKQLEAVDPELFSDSKLEWGKVFAQIAIFVEMRRNELSGEKMNYIKG
ncbi:hypothetical protein FRC07_012471, partial [Ceratobasidium sp. 392]